jgi:hypothetical protein
MRFQVPQFIDVEDKIFGPLTLKQFLYLAGGGAAIFILYTFLPFFLFVLLALPIGGFFLALAFYKVNGQPFIRVVENALIYFLKSKIYLWKKREAKIKRETQEEKGREKKQVVYQPKLTRRKLEDLAWSLDIKKRFER